MTVAGQLVRTRKDEPVACKPGVVYKPSRNRLYVFASKSVFVLSGGPLPQAWRKTTRRGWHAARPEVPCHTVHMSLPENDELPLWQLTASLRDQRGPYLPPFMETVRDAYCGDWGWMVWLGGLDTESRRAVEPFRERIWHLLMLALRCPGGIELLHSCPALAFALASSWVFRGERRVRQPLRSARSLLKKRQRITAGWLGFPETESTVRILRRVPTSEINIIPLLYLRDALRNPDAAQVLRHVPQVTREVIRLASDARLWRHTSPRLLIETGSGMQTEELPVSLAMWDTFRMLRQMGRESEGLVFRSREHLMTVHDETLDTFNRAGCDAWDTHWVVPPPPLQGTNTIVPLDCVEAFFQEGRNQQNCVASYAARVAESAAWSRDGQPSVYVYQVLWPQRATLSITRLGTKWVIEQLRCARNDSPTRETVDFVQGWLDCQNQDACNPTDERDWCELSEPDLGAVDEEMVPF